MSILILDDKSRAEIKRVLDYAEEHVYTMDDLLDIYNKAAEPPGYFPGFNCVINDYRIVFTYEMQNPGKMRHISISMANGKLPTIEAVEIIIKEFGYENPLHDCMISLEPISDNQKAVNVIEIVGKLMNSVI